ncbi:MAG TPA: hypothetical protein VGM62_20065 [Chthoniobacterales bacterium]|jgi:hypothetical protein
MNVTSHVRFLSAGLILSVFLPALLHGATPAPPGGFFPSDPDAKPFVVHRKNEGPNGTIYVYDRQVGGEFDCFYTYGIPAGKTMEDVDVLKSRIRKRFVVTFTNGEGDLDDLESEKFMIDCPGGSQISRSRKPVDLAAPATPTPTPIPISNDADALEPTCDGHYIVVVGSGGTKPVSLVDFDIRAEVSTYTFNGFSQSVAVCDDSHSVLVHLDNNSSNAGQIRRLTITSGALTDTMETLLLGSSSVFIKKVYAAPGSKTGIVLLQGAAAQVVSFVIPGLTTVDSVTLAGAIPNGLAFNCSGKKVYIRSGNRGINPDVIECFGFNPVTGFFTKPASLTINDVGPYTGVVYPEPMALTPDGTHVIASEANPSASATTPRITFFDAITGARADAIIDSGMTDPINVDVVDCCAQRKEITSIMRPANGHVMLQGKVESPNWTFSLQLAPNMATTFGNPISITSDSNGMFQYDDAGTVGLDKRFYRLTYP